MKTIKLEDGKEVKISEESYKALADSVNTMRVPDCIRFTEDGLVFNRGKQVLCNYPCDDIYRVTGVNPGDYMEQPKLVPIEKKDIRAGDWVYVTDLNPTDFKCKSNYKLMLKDKGEIYCYVCDDEDVRVNVVCWAHYYKVVFDD